MKISKALKRCTDVENGVWRTDYRVIDALHVEELDWSVPSTATMISFVVVRLDLHLWFCRPRSLRNFFVRFQQRVEQCRCMSSQ